MWLLTTVLSRIFLRIVFFFFLVLGYIGQDSQDTSNRNKDGSFVRRTMRSLNISEIELDRKAYDSTGAFRDQGHSTS